MSEKNTENIGSELNKETDVVYSTGSRMKKMGASKNGKAFGGGEIVSTEKLKKGFTATQKLVAFMGSILSLIVAGFTVNNLLNGKPAKPIDNTPQTSVVKIIEKSQTSSEKNSESNSSGSNSKENQPSTNYNSTNHNIEEKKNEKNESSEKNSESSAPREKEIVREIIREVPATTTNVVEKDSSSKTEPNTKSSVDNTHSKDEGETKPSLSDKSE